MTTEQTLPDGFQRYFPHDLHRFIAPNKNRARFYVSPAERRACILFNRDELDQLIGQERSVLVFYNPETKTVALKPDSDISLRKGLRVLIYDRTARNPLYYMINLFGAFRKWDVKPAHLAEVGIQREDGVWFIPVPTDPQ